MGDLNAVDNRSNEEVMGMHGLGEANDDGESFISPCSFNQLVIGGTVFPHERIHMATWISPDGRTENHIDHFGISKNFRRSLEDVRVMKEADAGTDHHLVLAKLRLKLKRDFNCQLWKTPIISSKHLSRYKREERIPGGVKK
ncbi:craniofacial development protein 2 [Elysia marginata]|uniref:Craniofacial development protein 2 n=1 Tax=Elysia marginata TaxID=1093978 RepID=A0AAV4HB41_9GAST|nr:craniofacial development protein 2 [Elysia marginata]